MDPFGHRIDVSRIEREIQKCSDLNTARALRALLDGVRQNAARLDALDAWRLSLDPKPRPLDGPIAGAPKPR